MSLNKIKINDSLIADSDISPIKESENLINSGSVYTGIKSERKDIVIRSCEKTFLVHDILEEALDHVIGKWLLWSNGQENVNEGYQYKIMKVRPQTSYIFPTNDNYNVCFYGADGEYISGIAANRNKVITTPTDIFYMAVSYKLTDDVKIYEGSDSASIEGISSKTYLKPSVNVGVGSIENIFEIGKNKFDSTNLINGIYFNAAESGKVYTNNSWSASCTYVPIKSNTSYWKTYESHICFYDKDLNFISGNTNSSAGSFITPTTAKYLRVSVPTAYSVRFMIIEGDEAPIEYEEFKITSKTGVNWYAFNKGAEDKVAVLHKTIKNIYLVRNEVPYDSNDSEEVLSLVKIMFFAGTGDYFAHRKFGIQIGWNENNRVSISTVESFTGTTDIARLEETSHFGNGNLICKYYDAYVEFNDVSQLETQWVINNYDQSQMDAGIMSLKKNYDTLPLSILNSISSNISSKETYEKENGNISIKDNINIEIGSLRNVINAGQNKFDSINIIEGKYFNAQVGGEMMTNESWEASLSYIPIKPQTNYYRNITSHICFYDEEFNFISGITGTTSPFTSPNNAKYLRASCEILWAQRFMITENTIPSTDFITFMPSLKNAKMLHIFNTSDELRIKIDNLIKNIYLIRNSVPFESSDNTGSLNSAKAIYFIGANSNGFGNRIFGMQIGWSKNNQYNRCSFATPESYNKIDNFVKLEKINTSGDGYLIDKYYNLYIEFDNKIALDSEWLYSDGNNSNNFNGAVLVSHKDMQSYILNKISNALTSYFTVAKDGRGDFTTVTEASAAAPANSVILIMPGVYDNEVVIGCSTKKQYFIGIDKAHTIIKNSLGDYNNCPILIGAGSLKNLTVYAEKTTVNAVKPPYAVHSECHTLYNDKLLIENCDLISDYDAGVGIGMRGGCIVEIRNSKLQGVTRGIYCHDSDYMIYNGRQQLSLINNIIIGTNSNYGIWIQSQGSAERTFEQSQYYIEAINNRITSLSTDNPQGYYHNFTNWYPNSGAVISEDFGGAKNVRLMKTSWNNSDSFFNSTL